MHIEIAQDLGAETDIAPDLLAQCGAAGLLAAHFLSGRHAGGAFAQIDEDAAAFAPEDIIDRVEHMRTAEDIGDDILAMEPHRDVPAAADVAEDEGQMLDAVERRRIGEATRFADRRVDVELALLIDEALACLAIGDEIGDRDDLEPVLARE